MHGAEKWTSASVLVCGLLLAVLAPTSAAAWDFSKGVSPSGTITGIGGKCLDVLMSITDDGTPVVLYECTGNPNQDWVFDFVGGDVLIRGIGDKCMLAGPVGSTGSREVEIGSCADPAALWRIGMVTTSLFGLLNVSADECLDVWNSNTSNGNPIIVFECMSTANQLFTFNEGGQTTDCMPTADQMCLNEGRFAVEVDWVKPDGETGVGSVVPAGTDDSGLFWFFNATNWEMLVKVLDNCDGPSNRFWVFASASTTIQYTLKVTDTETGQVREYFNPQGNRAAAIADTQAFATCP